MTTKVESKVKSLREELAMMEKYLLLKYAQRDWHGVADAAMDIREIEAQLKVLGLYGN